MDVQDRDPCVTQQHRILMICESSRNDAAATSIDLSCILQGDPDSVPAFLKLLHPTLTAQFVLARQVSTMSSGGLGLQCSKSI